MEISDHAKKRYIERILDITDKNDIKNYLSEKNTAVTFSIEKLIQNAIFVYCGQIGSNSNEKVNFYISGDIVLLTNLDNTKVITLYKVDLPYSTDINKTVISKMTEEICKLNDELAATKENISKVIEKKKIEIEKIDIELELYNKKINILKKRRTLLSEEIDSEEEKADEVKLSLKNYANILCNSLEYKSEMLQNKFNN